MSITDEGKLKGASDANETDHLDLEAAMAVLLLDERYDYNDNFICGKISCNNEPYIIYEK